MRKAIVATHCVSDASALTEEFTTLQFGDPVYYLLQRADKITNWKKGTPEVADIEAYTRGRLFGKNGEIRWEKTVDGYSLLWLSEKDKEGDLPEPFTALGGEWEASAPQDVLLLGGGDTQPWRDTRIPRKLDYPMQWCESPQVRVIQYKDRHSQTIRFTRYTKFVNK